MPTIHPDFHGVVGPDASVEPDTYDGHEGVRRYFALWEETMTDLQLEVHTVEALNEWFVVAELTIRGRGAGSGAPAELTAWSSMEFEDGLLVGMQGFADRESAVRVAEGAGG